MVKFKQFRIKLGTFVLLSGALLLAALTAIAAPLEDWAEKRSVKENAVQPVVIAQEDGVEIKNAKEDKAPQPVSLTEEEIEDSKPTLASKIEASGEIWTLESSVKEAIKVSPTVLAADAEIDAKKGSLSQAGAWPNPSISLSGSQKLGLEDRRGGTDLTQYSVSQPIPLGRLSRQKKQARAELEASMHGRLYEQLLQENAAARHFHELQLATVELKLASEKLQFANHYQRTEGGKDPLVRYLAPLERKRLDIIRETADQQVATAEGEYSETLANFQAFLRLPKNALLKTTELTPIDSPLAIEKLVGNQEQSHSAILTSKYEKEAAEASVSVAKNKRFEDPTVTFFREKDFLDGRRQDYSGVMVNVSIPLWDFKNGEVARAKAEAKKASYKLEAQKQILQSKLNETHLHLGHLIEQANHYRTRILKPAKEVFELTKKGFAAGEVNVLALIDASDTYFDSRKRYLELLYESHIEAAEVRLAAGISLLNNESSPNKKGRK